MARTTPTDRSKDCIYDFIAQMKERAETVNTSDAPEDDDAQIELQTENDAEEQGVFRSDKSNADFIKQLASKVDD